MPRRTSRSREGRWGRCRRLRAVLLLAGILAGMAGGSLLGASALAGGQPAGAAPGGLTVPAGLTGVTVTSPDAAGYDLSFTVNQATSTPALLAVAVPGVQFPTAASQFTVTCTPSCSGAPHPVASVWGIGATPAQTGASSVVLNLFADTGAATPPFTGTFAAGATLTVDLTGLTKPADGSSLPVSVATEPAPGAVAESGSTTTPSTPPDTPALRTTGMVATATPDSLGYPDAVWTDQVGGIDVERGATGALSLYVPGATFPTAGTSYAASTCTFTETGSPVTAAGCSGVTVGVDAAATSGLPGTAAVLDVEATTATPTALRAVTALHLQVTGVANPGGAGGASGTLVAGEGTTTFDDLVGAGAGSAPTLVASPTVGLSSTAYPAFPASATVGDTTDFGLSVADASDYSWPDHGASLTFTLAGIADLTPADLSVACSYAGTSPPGSTPVSPFTFTTQGRAVVSGPVDVPVEAGATLELGCALALSSTVLPGALTVGVDLDDDTGPTPFLLASTSATTTVAPAPSTGYTFVAADGGVFTYGSAAFYGSMGDQRLNRPIVGMAATPTGKGYWLVASDGGIFTFGSAAFYGSMGGQRLNRPIVGMAATPTGKGYWLVASDGGIFTFGNAAFEGSAGSLSLRAPIVGMAATSDGKGYWLVAADGGIFTFGNAAFKGSAGSLSLRAPIVGMAATSDGEGYWLVAADGGIFTFGTAPFEGSAGALSLNRPVAGMLPTSDGKGYWLVASDGGIFSYGDAGFYGSAGSLPLVAPVVGMS